MASFVAVVDRDQERRSRFILDVERVLAPTESLSSGACASGDLAVAWAAHPRAPVDHAVDEDGATVVWGEAIAGPRPERLTAATLRDVYRTPGPSHAPAPLDGFHAGLDYEPTRGLLAAADLLGTFPVYYWSTEELLIVASSPTPFRHHPSFSVALDPYGFVGILLTHYMVDGRTLLEGVRRLGAGNALRWRPRAGASELSGYRIPVSLERSGLPLSAEIERLDTALTEATARQTPPTAPYTLLLSGGRDSRIVAAYMAEAGASISTLTMGHRGDHDARLARRVAGAIGAPNTLREISFDEFPTYARLQARYEHGSNGFASIHGWGVAPLLDSASDPVVSGLLAGGIIGGTDVAPAYDPSVGRVTFDRFFARLNGWGVGSPGLRRLLRPELFGDAVEATVERVREIYHGYPGLDADRVRCYTLHHRQRYHIGGNMWRYSFGAWPIAPIADSAVLEATGAISTAGLTQRVVQDALLARRFRKLATIPLVQRRTPLRLTARGVMDAAVGARARSALHGLGGGSWRRQRWRFHRLYDINNPGWHAVRKKAEPGRRLAERYLDAAKLAAIVPPPASHLSHQNTVVDSGGAKSLIGFFLWCQEHLD